MSTTHVLHWWKKLEEDPGKRAGLRRCKKLEEVFLEPGFYDLFWELDKTDWRNKVAIAAVAGVLSHIRHEPTTAESLIKSCANKKKNSDSPQVSPLRFRRLIGAKTSEEFYADLIRIINLIGKTASIEDTAERIYKAYQFKAYTPESKSNLFSEWAFEYYGA